MASEELVNKERKMRQEILARSELAKSRAEQRGESFAIDDWAFGTRSNVRYPYGPPYEPVVSGIPSVWRSIVSMSPYEWTEIVAYTGLMYGVGAAIGSRVGRYSPVGPRAWGTTLGIFAAYATTHANAATSAHRLMGFRPNGKNLRPAFEGWQDDSAPLSVKMETVTIRHPNQSVQSGVSAASTFND